MIMCSNRDKYDKEVNKCHPTMCYPSGSNLSWRTKQNKFEFLECRTDMLHHKIYTVDPEGCLDADDAFSFENIDINTSCLHIHLCDPTSHMNPRGEGNFRCALTNRFSSHPIGRKTRHMFSRSFTKNCSLKMVMNALDQFCHSQL